MVYGETAKTPTTSPECSLPVAPRTSHRYLPASRRISSRRFVNLARTDCDGSVASCVFGTSGSVGSGGINQIANLSSSNADWDWSGKNFMKSTQVKLTYPHVRIMIVAASICHHPPFVV